MPHSQESRGIAGIILTSLMASLLAVIGIAMALGGVMLLGEGGSAYYLAMGLALLACATGLFLRRRWSLWLYGAALAATMIWALWESGFDFWALLARLGMFVGLGAALLLLRVRRRAGSPCAHVGVQRLAGGLLAAVPVLALAASTSGAMPFGRDPSPVLTSNLAIVGAAPGSEDDWQAYGGTSAGTRFSELATITPENVSRLKVAWTYELADPHGDGLEVTPLKIGGSIYACNASNVVVSLDASTGRQRWLFDPRIDGTNLLARICRGVGYYKVPGATGPCAERIYTNTVDARLFAIDARTGRRCTGFGNNGEVSLLDNMGEVLKGYLIPTSAPTVARGMVVVNGSILDNQYVGEPSGVVRAFDGVTGKLAWAYDAGAPNRVGQPEAGQVYTRATPNSWAPMTYDDALGLVYVPIGSPTPDYYGVLRSPIADEIGNSLLALDVESGRRRWIFQAIHHDLWDYDLASSPVLFDMPGAHGMVRALALPTKRGETFLLDRTNGRPIDPVVEKPVSTRGGVPGERISPTQPFPQGMPSLADGHLTEARLWGLTPLDQLWCRIRFRGARYEGQMTPPGLTPSIMYPGYLGGMDWGGVAVDHRHAIMIAATNQVANYVKLITRKEADAVGARPFGMGATADLKKAQGIAVQHGTPFAAITTPFFSPLMVPCQQPPWSKLTAVDLRTRRVLWSRPLGTGQDNGPFGIASRLPATIGVPAVGASLLTASGITFVGASTDRTFRAFETRSGKLLWQVPLPASANSGPMTYKADGRQFIVVAAGGHHILRAPTGQKLIAYALPQS
ncbi:membrane-bound PQQ-dependent dehydrogenase, glucose/quinate/shikimate family [Pseudomonas sp.]|uniref:membrane-bound PQQ-dependent dehydrogenase, glucose/quinate/shikimate family n=1 Tax=Pseudomonas sp. TaxID=306 RepID=UPI003D126390